MSCTAQSDDWIFQASFKKDLATAAVTRPTPVLRALTQEETPRQRVGDDQQLPSSLTKDIERRLQRNERIRLGSVRVEAAVRHLVEFDNDRTSDLRHEGRYPYELPGLWALLVLGVGVGLILLGRRGSSLSSALARRIKALEDRMDAHESDVGRDVGAASEPGNN
jgi:hypothetical protein